MDNRFQELSSLDFKKVDIGLKETELIKEYAQLKFNGGFVLATIECRDSEKFRDYLQSMYPVANDMNLNMRSAADDVKDFMYYLLGSQSLAGLEIYLGDGEEFLLVDPPYDELEEFRKLAFAELSENEMKKRLLQTVIRSSIYDDWKVSGEQTSKMINDFIDRLYRKSSNFMTLEFQQWGNFMIGLFVGFIFIDFDRGQITFFASDDYD